MKIILIGSSTGGPNQLKFLLNDVDVKDTCVVIAQHMSPSFIPSFIKQFDKEAISDVCILEDKQALGHQIYICPKNTILTGNLNLSAEFSPVQTTFNPNVNLLFNSAVIPSKTNKIMAILLTGMGDDGAKGLFNLYKAGVKCLCENEEDSVVYGMPKRAKDLNPKLMPMSLFEIKREIIKFIDQE